MVIVSFLIVEKMLADVAQALAAPPSTWTRSAAAW